MTDNIPAYSSKLISIFEWGQPICELYDKALDSYVHITTPEYAKAVIKSLEDFLSSIPKEFGGTKE